MCLHMWHSVCVKVRRHLAGVCWPCECWRSNSSCQTWWQASLPTEPSCEPCFFYFKESEPKGPHWRWGKEGPDKKWEILAFEEGLPVKQSQLLQLFPSSSSAQGKGNKAQACIPGGSSTYGTLCFFGGEGILWENPLKLMWVVSETWV